MAMTDRQKRYYASAPHDEFQQQGLSLIHPAFSQTWHLTDWQESFDAKVAGVVETFLVHPFRAKLPKVDSSGKYEMKMDVFKTPTLVKKLRAAGLYPKTRIIAIYNTYLRGDPEPQRDAIQLDLSVGAMKGDWCTLSAVRADVVNMKFPNVFYRIDQFPGLNR